MFGDVTLFLPNGESISVQKWHAEALPPAQLRRSICGTGKQGMARMEFIRKRAEANGTLALSLAKTECLFSVTALMSPTGSGSHKKRERREERSYKIVCVLKEIVVSDGEFGVTVVPKFGLCESTEIDLLKIRNYDRYVEWCSYLREAVLRLEDGIYVLLWTTQMQEAMESIYGLRCVEDVELPILLKTIVDPQTRDWYTVAFGGYMETYTSRLSAAMASADVSSMQRADERKFALNILDVARSMPKDTCSTRGKVGKKLNAKKVSSDLEKISVASRSEDRMMAKEEVLCDLEREPPSKEKSEKRKQIHLQSKVPSLDSSRSSAESLEKMPIQPTLEESEAASVFVEESSSMLGQCVICMEAPASHIMMPCRHLTHCEECHRLNIDTDRQTKKKHHQGSGPSQKLNKGQRERYLLECCICRREGTLKLWKGQAFFLP